MTAITLNAQKTKSVELANIWETFSVTNTIKFDTSIHTQKLMIWKQFFACHCKGYSAAPVSEYINNGCDRLRTEGL